MAVLFDLDGTLLDTSHDLYAAMTTLLQQEQRTPIPYEVFRAKVGMGATKMLALAFDIKPEHDSKGRNYIKALTPRLLELYRATEFKGTQPFEGIDALLSNIEALNIPWGIVTNRLHEFTVPLLKSVGYLERSACVVSGDTTPHSKPHPEPLLHACRLLQIDPKQCLYVGDSETDIQAGKAAAMKTMAVAFGYIDPGTAINAWQADYVAHSANDIFPWIRRWSSNEV